MTLQETLLYRTGERRRSNSAGLSRAEEIETRGVGYGLRRMRETGASRPERNVVGSLPFIVAVVDRNLKAKKLLS